MTLTLFTRPVIRPGRVIIQSRRLYSDYRELIEEYGKCYLRIFASFDTLLKPVSIVKIEYITDVRVDEECKCVEIDITRSAHQIQVFSSNYVLCTVYYIGGKYVYGVEDVLEIDQELEDKRSKVEVLCEISRRHCELCGRRLLEEYTEPIYKLSHGSSITYICSRCFKEISECIEKKNFDNVKIGRLVMLLRYEKVEDLVQELQVITKEIRLS